MSNPLTTPLMFFSLAPRGASGLKFDAAGRHRKLHQSRPARGEWIEIRQREHGGAAGVRSRPARGEWIEITLMPGAIFADWSRPARGEWIEIVSSLEDKSIQEVSPREGRVD